ncbi:MAG: Hpt domain-containing protein [Paracraurococcus sp.]
MAAYALGTTLAHDVVTTALTSAAPDATHAAVSALDPSIAEQLAQDLPPEDFRRIVETFEDDLGRLAGELEQAGLSGNLDAYRRAAHSLAGAAAAVGAVMLERTARVAMDPRATLTPPQMVPMIRAQATAALQELAALAAQVGQDAGEASGSA